MKNNFSHVGLAKLCGWFGITRQAYYQDGWKGIEVGIEEDLLLKAVAIIRNDHKRIGTRKLYEMVQPFVLEHQIKIGRDKFFDLLSANHLLIRRRKRKIQTTWSKHWLRKYPNLIRDFIPVLPNQLWVSDITYWKVLEHPLYISFITDAYSHQIVGHHLAETLEAIESITALEMALKANVGCLNNLIHHSDRGIQYCSHGYVDCLKKKSISISMTENGDPLENAVAERVNGIIKSEYLDTYEPKTFKDAKACLAKAVSLYNSKRPHMSISNYTPETVHNSKLALHPKRLWKNYYKKKTQKDEKVLV